MVLRLKKAQKKFIVALSMVTVLGLLVYGGGRLSRALESAIDNFVVNGQVRKLRSIDLRLQRNYHIVQGLFLSKVWEEKFAFYDDKKVARYLGSESLSAKLFLQAEPIGRKYGIELEAELKPLTYFYKEENQEVAVGFIVLDYAGIKIGKINQ